MDAGLHLPQIDFSGEGLSWRRLAEAVDAARECGFAAVSANDHFVYPRPWLDGHVALAAVMERSGEMRLATTIALAGLRGPVALAKALAALDVLSGGRVIAGLGPGSSQADYDALGVPFDDRWPRFDEAAAMVRALLRRDSRLDHGSYFSAPVDELEPCPADGVPLWIGSWGSEAGLRRVARLGDGWLASAYNATPEHFSARLALLRGELERRQRPAADFPNALVTMWTWITSSRRDAERVIGEVLAPMLRREPDELRGQLCVGEPEACAELLSHYARAGCRRVHFWPLGEEARQVELIASQVMPRVSG